MTDVQINDPYFGKRDEFFYFEITDKSTQRDNKISELFDEQVIKFYHSPSGRTDKIYLAKFWKDKDSALRFINFRKKDNLLLKVINREEFIKSEGLIMNRNNKHNALHDTLVIKACHDKLIKMINKK